MNIRFIVNVEILVFIKWSYVGHIMFICRLSNFKCLAKFVHVVQSHSNTYSFGHLFLEPHRTTYRLNTCA